MTSRQKLTRQSARIRTPPPILTKDHLLPEDCNEHSEEEAEVAYDAAVLTVIVRSLSSGLVAGAELADSIQNYIPVKAAQNMICEIDTEGINGGLLRGGFGTGELRVIADEGKYGTVDVSTDFGETSTGSEIYSTLSWNVWPLLRCDEGVAQAVV